MYYWAFIREDDSMFNFDSNQDFTHELLPGRLTAACMARTPSQAEHFLIAVCKELGISYRNCVVRKVRSKDYEYFLDKVGWQ